MEKKGFLNSIIFGVAKSVSSAAKSAYEGVKSGLGMSEEKKPDDEGFKSDDLGAESSSGIATCTDKESEIERCKKASEFEAKYKKGDIADTDVSDAATTDFKFCYACGEKLDIAANFCTNCGQKLT